MEMLAINPQRLEWYCNEFSLSVEDLSRKLKISKNTLNNTLQGKKVLSIKQLEKISKYFNRGVLFWMDPDMIEEKTGLTPQFRTIKNENPNMNLQLKTLIETVEVQRNIYMFLLEELEEKVNCKWKKLLPFLEGELSEKKCSKIRKSLGICKGYTFNQIRGCLESVGIMVIVSQGYSGNWKIEDERVRGFSLYYDSLPIIVIKKQESKGAQAFTLMHEFGHILLHQKTMFDNSEDLFNQYKNKELEANEFAGGILIPQEEVKSLSFFVRGLSVQSYDRDLKRIRDIYCVSTEAILVRLGLLKNYATYKELRTSQEVFNKRGGGNRVREKEPLHIFGKPFVETVFEALWNEKITECKASDYLDNLKIEYLRKLEKSIVSF